MDLFRNFPQNLRCYAPDGAAGGTSAEGNAAVSEVAAATTKKGVKVNPLANVKYGIQDEAQVADVQADVVAPDTRAEEFERLIKGEYKDLFDQRMQDTIQKRLKSSKETVDKYEALSPVLELLGKKYGVDVNDAAALNKAIEEDDSFFEDEALERGISVEQLKEIRKMERENADLKRQMAEKQTQERASQIYAQWMEQSKATQTIYPTFNLNEEMQNPRFLDLLRSNIDVRTAYEVVHKDEILPAAMQFTAKKVEQKLTNSIIAGRNRPAENGLAGASASIVKSDVSKLSKADREEIIRRVQAGEKIRF